MTTSVGMEAIYRGPDWHWLRTGDRVTVAERGWGGVVFVTTGGRRAAVLWTDLEVLG